MTAIKSKLTRKQLESKKDDIRKALETIEHLRESYDPYENKKQAKLFDVNTTDAMMALDKWLETYA